MTHDAKESNSSHVTHEAQKSNSSHGSNSTRKTDYHSNVTTYVSLMSQRLEPPHSVETLGLCNYYHAVIVTVIITTIANSIFFIFLLTFCMKSSKTQIYN